MAAVIEEITKRKFVHFMENDVFVPLNMQHTFAEANGNILINSGKQYVRKKDKGDLAIQRKKDGELRPVHSRDRMRLYNAPFVDCINKFAGGGYVSTCVDVASFGDAMVLGDFLSEEVKGKLFMDVANEYNYGVGWSAFRDADGQVVEVSHSGGAVGGGDFDELAKRESVQPGSLRASFQTDVILLCI